MLINDEKKFIFIAVPRAASGTIRLFFNKPRGKWFKGPTHGTALEAKRNYAKGKFDNYFKFTFVRNPWARMYSWYNWRKEITIPFKQWLLEEDTYLRWKHAPIQKIQQCWFVCDNNGKVLLDFVGRVETLRTDYEFICNKLNVTSGPLQTRHATKHGPYQDVYDSETIEFVAHYHKDDIETFGYSFDE